MNHWREFSTAPAATCSLLIYAGTVTVSLEYRAPGDMGYDGWQRSLLDLHLLQRWLSNRYARPVILLGHSMGAMLAQQYLGYFGHTLSPAYSSGSTGALPALTTG